jgi:hypothetical protein
MVLNGAGGWENRNTLATDAKMREEGEEKEKRKGERRWEKNPSPVHGIRHMRKTTKPPPQNPSEPPSRPNNSRETSRSPGARYWLRAGSSSSIYRRNVVSSAMATSLCPEAVLFHPRCLHGIGDGHKFMACRVVTTWVFTRTVRIPLACSTLSLLDARPCAMSSRSSTASIP